MHPSLLLSTFAGIYEQVYQNRPFVLAVVSVLMVPVNRNFQMLLQIKIINYNLTIIFASVSIQVKRCVKYSTTTTIIYKYTNDVALHIILHKFNIHVQLKNRKWDKLIKTVKYHEKVFKKIIYPNFKHLQNGTFMSFLVYFFKDAFYIVSRNLWQFISNYSINHNNHGVHLKV